MPSKVLERPAKVADPGVDLPPSTPVGPAETLTVPEMTHAELKVHTARVEELLRALLRMGYYAYSQYRDRPDGKAYLEAMDLVGDEGMRLRAQGAANRIQSGRIE